MDTKNIQPIADTLFSIIPLFKKKLFRLDKCDETHDLSPSHFQILFFLNDHGKVPISEVGKGLNISKPNMTPLIKKLINKELVEKVRDKQDKRYVNVGITDKGKRFISDHKKYIVKNLKKKLSKLSDNDLKKLSTSLNELKEIISKLD